MRRRRRGPFATGFSQGWVLGEIVSSLVLGMLGLIAAVVRIVVHASWKNPFLSEKARELRETERLYGEVRQAFLASPYASDEGADKFAFDLVMESCERAGVIPTHALVRALFVTARGLLVAEGALFGFPQIDFSAEFTLEEGVALRNYLVRKRQFLADHVRLEEIWREKVIRIFEGITGYLPASAFLDDESQITTDAQARSSFTASLVDLADEPALAIERTIVTMFDDDVVNARLFDPIRDRLQRNLLEASGIPLAKAAETAKPLLYPTDASGQSNEELVEGYLAATPFAELFGARFPFSIPFPARFEHSLVVGGTGHGKTQLLQLLILEDLEQAQEDGRSVVVIDSQGDLIRTISHLACFSPTAERSLADRLLIVDPNDVDYPICLNMFDWNRERVGQLSPLDREKILNGTVELYEYLFGALLGAELTQRQGVVFKYLARLMMAIPDATIDTLRALMEDGEPYRPYMETLPGSALSFFRTRFFDRTFNETKKQILTRLWGVLSSPTFERMFSHPRNKVDIFEATQSGKIILINTAKELLKHEGCAIFGRFFIALIAQAALQRAAVPPHERRPTFVYIDEAEDYFDDTVGQLLTQARKYRVGMVLAHQNLDQLSPDLRASVMANTTIKFAGGVSAKDANVFANEMRCESDFVRAMRKRKDTTEFACFVRNLTPSAVQVQVPLGFVERLPTLSAAEYEALVAENRTRYCSTVDEVSREAEQRPRKSEPETIWPVAPKEAEQRPAELKPRPARALPVPKPAFVLPKRPSRPIIETPAPLGRGGREHKYLQQLLKGLAEARGYRAVIEEQILEGAGRVDVSLSRGANRIACEISVTTSHAQELANVEKCLAAGYEHVAVVAPRPQQLNTLRKFLAAQIEESVRDRVRYLAPEDFATYLDMFGERGGVEEKTVRGYRIKLSHTPLEEAEAQARRAAVAQVIARSLKGSKAEAAEGTHG